jgi:hypothetical protein
VYGFLDKPDLLVKRIIVYNRKQLTFSYVVVLFLFCWRSEDDGYEVIMLCHDFFNGKKAFIGRYLYRARLLMLMYHD